jgi:hypothetical protein
MGIKRAGRGQKYRVKVQQERRNGVRKEIR